MRRVVLQFSRVGVSHSGYRLLDDVDVTFGRGVTGLVGANGAGKTTLTRLAASALQPSVGVVMFNGSAIWQDKKALRDYRRRSGWMPQAPGFPPAVTVRDFLYYSAWLKEVAPARRRQSIDDAMVVSDVTGLAHRKIGRLSGGEQRRVGLACALVNDPEVLLLDEPTVGLDPEQREGFLKTVTQVSSRKTVVLATHLLEDLVLCADALVGLSSGRVVLNEPVTAPSLAELREKMRTVFASGRM